MPKTTLFINENNDIKLKKEMNETKLSARAIVNIALDKHFNDISNKELLKQIVKLK